MSALGLWTETPYQSLNSPLVGASDNCRLVRVCLRNTTKNFSRKQIAEILQFGMPPEMPDFDVTVSNRFQDRFRGVCYPFGCTLRSDNAYKPLIIARINTGKNEYPSWIDRGKDGPKRCSGRDESTTVAQTRTIRKKGYISLWIRSAEECLIYVLAHEQQHLWQRDHKEGWVWDSKGKKSSERDADAYAIRKVREWRRKHSANEAEQAYHAAASLSFYCVPKNNRSFVGRGPAREGKLLKSLDLSIKSNSAANPAIIRYRCILCSQIISHDKRYTDIKGKPIPLDEKGKSDHDCAAESHGGFQLEE